MKYLTILIVVLFPLVVCAGTPVSETKTLELSAEGIEKTIIECGAGFLTVEGVEGLASIQVSAEIVVEKISKDDLKKFIDKHIILTLEKKGSKARLKSEVKQPILTSNNARINLTVKLPREMPLDISDGSGSMKVVDLIGDLDIDDGSGSMDIQGITGNVQIKDGSGSMEIESVDGALSINDGSGSIELESINGNLNITDGSGSIDAKSIGGNVNITDGSGGIDLQKISGNVNVTDGSGEIGIQQVSGNVNVTDGSGDINIDGVDQNVTILQGGSGSETIQNVKGIINRVD